MASEYDALLRDADAMIAEDDRALSGCTMYEGMPDTSFPMRVSRSRDNRAALAAALRASEARAEMLEARVAELESGLLHDAVSEGQSIANRSLREALASAEKRERAYREALLAVNGALHVPAFCIEVGCNNPATTTKLWNLSKVPVCPEHAPESEEAK